MKLDEFQFKMQVYSFSENIFHLFTTFIGPTTEYCIENSILKKENYDTITLLKGGIFLKAWEEQERLFLLHTFHITPPR